MHQLVRQDRARQQPGQAKEDANRRHFAVPSHNLLLCLVGEPLMRTKPARRFPDDRVDDLLFGQAEAPRRHGVMRPLQEAEETGVETRPFREKARKHSVSRPCQPRLKACLLAKRCGKPQLRSNEASFRPQPPEYLNQEANASHCILNVNPRKRWRCLDPLRLPDRQKASFSSTHTQVPGLWAELI
jgi:hypothetical protein